MNVIGPGLFLGDLTDAQSFDGPILCVLEERPQKEPLKALHIPVCIIDKNGNRRTNTSILNYIAGVIEGTLQKEGKILVHCMAGVERSPLVVAWLLHTRGISIGAAYGRIMSIRPEVLRCDDWIEDHNAMTDCRWCKHG